MVTVLISALGHGPRENRLKSVGNALVERISLDIRAMGVEHRAGIIYRLHHTESTGLRINQVFTMAPQEESYIVLAYKAGTRYN